MGRGGGCGFRKVIRLCKYFTGRIWSIGLRGKRKRKQQGFWSEKLKGLDLPSPKSGEKASGIVLFLSFFESF